MIACVNKSSKEFKELLSTVVPRQHPIVLAAKINEWQELNNTTEFPTKEQIELGKPIVREEKPLQELDGQTRMFSVDTNSINYQLKSVNILQSDKAKQIFDKGTKNHWPLDKILSELQIPSDQKRFILDSNIRNREDIIIHLMSNYSFVVESNIGIKTTTPMEWDNIENKYIPIIELSEMVESDYYSNLTVPGGTNYTENEISTPLITPNIKGHAQFSTDQGIGWFRSDEMLVSGGLTSEQLNNIPLEYQEESLHSTKTRRVLELQSDLFQKGRDRNDLTKVGVEYYSDPEGNEMIQFEINGIRYTEFEGTYTMEDGTDPFGNPSEDIISKEEFNNKYNEYKILHPRNQSPNQFLQLLNKDNNWVTFFVKTIIQDSIKKGYEKVLFPKGETAAKIEGHETIANEIEKINRDIQELKDNPTIEGMVLRDDFTTRISTKDGLYTLWTGPYHELEPWDTYTTIEEAKKNEIYVRDKFKRMATKDDVDRYNSQIEDLERQKQNLKTQGFEKLKPIEAFYEIKVSNVLKKLGKINVITDEFGNQWNEVDLSDPTILKSIDPILLSIGANNGPNIEPEYETALRTRIDTFLAKMGFKMDSKGTLTDVNGNPIEARAMVDFINKLVSVAEGKSDISDLTEEAIHILVRILKTTKDPLYKEMLEQVTSTDEWKEVMANYSDVAGYDNDLLLEEAIGKVVKNIILARKHENSDVPVYKNWFDKLVAWFKSLGSKIKTDPFIRTAQIFMNEEYDSYITQSNPSLEGGEKMFKKQEKTRDQSEVLLKETQDRLEKRVYTQEQIAGTKVYKGINETVERYYDKTDSVIISNRITDSAEKLHNVNNTIKEARAISNLPVSVLARIVGNKGHSTMENILLALVNKTSLSKIEKDSGFNSTDFAKLVKAVQTIIDQTNEIQKRIDPTKEVSWHAEQKILSKSLDEGGTIDLLAIFSDNSAAIYEYKFKQISGFNSVVDPLTKRRTLTKDIVSDDAEEEYDIQLSRQMHILKDNYGITNVRISRLVPFAVSLEYNPATKEKTEKVVELFSPFDGYEHLQILSLAGESSGIETLDKKLKSGYTLLSALRIKRRTSTNPEDREKLGLTIRNLSKSLQKAQQTFDISLMLDAAYALTAPLLGTTKTLQGKILHANEEYINGKKNPQYMSTDELMELKGQLEAYNAMLKDNFDFYIAAVDTLGMAKVDTLKVRVGLVGDMVEETLNQVTKRISERLTSTAKQEYSVNLQRTPRQQGIMALMFNTLSEIDHPVFEYARNIIFEADGITRRKTLELAGEIEKLQKDLFAYADSIGVKHIDIYDKFIEDEGFHLKSMYKKELYSEWLPKARSTGNTAWIKKHFDVSEKYLANYPTYLEKQKSRIDDLYPDEHVDEKTIVSKAKLRREILENWIANNDPSTNTFWLNAKRQGSLTVKEEFKDQLYSDDYKAIAAVPAMKAMYDFMIDKNREFAEIVGNDKLSLNFIPKVRKSLVDEAAQSHRSWAKAWEIFVDSHRVKQDGIMGQYDPATGELQYKIPLLFVNPFRDKSGEIDTKQNSRDLGRNLMLFGQSVYNYQQKSGIEATILALEDFLRMNSTGEIKTSMTNAPEKDLKLNLRTIKSESTSLGTFQRLMKYYLYGQKLQDDKMVKVFGAELSRNSLLRSVMQFHRAKTLGFAIIPPLAARVAGEGSIYFEGMKGRFYSVDNMKESHKMFYSNKKEARALVQFLNVYQEDRSLRLAHGLSASTLSKTLTLDNMYKGYSFADEKIDNTVAMAMALSHGINKEGNVYKLSQDDIAKGEKNIMQLFYIKDDKADVKGMTEKSYQQFRSKIRSVTGSIKGQMTSEDINAINTHIMGNMLMMYKNWMPRVIKERLGSFRYNPVTGTFDQGRYRVVASSIFNEQATFATVLKDIGMTGLRMIGLADNFKKYKLGEEGTEGYERAKRIVENEYNKFMTQYEGDERFEDFTIDDFIDMRNGQMRAFIAEARVIVLFLAAMVAGKMDWDDDGQAEYKDLWLTRKLFQILNRSQSEWSFVWNPMEWKNFIQNPLAISGIFTDVLNIGHNTLDEIRDAIGNENANNDKTPWFYFSSKFFVPGSRNVISFLELFAQEKEKLR